MNRGSVADGEGEEKWKGFSEGRQFENHYYKPSAKPIALCLASNSLPLVNRQRSCSLAWQRLLRDQSGAMSVTTYSPFASHGNPREKYYESPVKGRWISDLLTFVVQSLQYFNMTIKGGKECLNDFERE